MFNRTIFTHIDINASAEKIWSILTDFSQYPNWGIFIENIEGIAENGASLKVTIRPDNQKAMHFTPHITQLTPNHYLKWLGGLWGKKMFFLGEHIFKLEQLDETTTRLTHEENFSGILVPLVWSVLGKSTLKGFEDFNLALKTRAEN